MDRADSVSSKQQRRDAVALFRELECGDGERARGE